MYFQKKRCIAMLLAGGQGSRLKVLTEKTAKPAVPFGGKYRIIDFPLSNCVNSGIDFRKGRGTRDQIANILWIMEKNKRVPEKHLFLLY